MSARALVKQEDVTRIMRGARNAGYARVRMTIDPDGRIMVDASDDPESLPERKNPLDRLLADR